MKGRRKGLTALALALCAGLALVTGTYAWLSKEQASDGVYTALSDFEVEGVLSFGGNQYTGAEVLIPVSFDPNANNYIGNMKYSVRYTGVSPAYLRVRILEQWLDTAENEIMPVNYLDYALSTEVNTLLPAKKEDPSLPAASQDEGALAQSGAWVDRRQRDYCYYYSVPIQPKNLPVNKSGGTAIQDGSVELVLIDQAGATAEETSAMIQGIDPATTQLTLILQVEAVQPNRIREFWGVDQAPPP